MVTNPQSGTNIHEIAAGIYRINTPLQLPDGSAFSFNQYLVADDAPLLFHTGPRKLFPLVEKANDQPTADLLTQRLEVHEKTAWMLRSLLDE